MDEWVCAGCGELIGVYEPLVIHDDAGGRLTSRAAEPDLKPVNRQRYHRHCHVLAFDDRGRPTDAG